MYKIFFNTLAKHVALVTAFATMTSVVYARDAAVNNDQISDTVTRILTEKPLKTSEAGPKYNLSVTESFIKGRNHFSKLDSKSTGDVKTISLNVKANDKWEYGLNYLYSKTKFQMVEDNRVERNVSSDVLPYGTYFFTEDSFLTVLGGGRFGSTKISQNTDGLAKGRTSVATGILAADVGMEKDFGLWNPSISAGLLYENEKTSKYTLSDGTFTKKQWIHFLQGQVVGQVAMNMHENFQPYVKTGYKSILRRSATSYTIENWYGWVFGGGVNLFSAEKWNAGVDYEYNKTPKGERQNSFMLKLAVSF